MVTAVARGAAIRVVAIGVTKVALPDRCLDILLELPCDRTLRAPDLSHARRCFDSLYLLYIIIKHLGTCIRSTTTLRYQQSDARCAHNDLYMPCTSSRFFLLVTVDMN